MKRDSEQFFQEIKKDLTRYGELRLELLKLGAYEKAGKVFSVLSYSLILLTLAFFLTLFLFLALGFFLSEWLHSTGVGFSIVAILYVMLVGGVVAFKTKIRRLILNAILEMLMNDEDDEDTPPVTNASWRRSAKSKKSDSQCTPGISKTMRAVCCSLAYPHCSPAPVHRKQRRLNPPRNNDRVRNRLPNVQPQHPPSLGSPWDYRPCSRCPRWSLLAPGGCRWHGRWHNPFLSLGASSASSGLSAVPSPEKRKSDIQPR